GGTVVYAEPRRHEQGERRLAEARGSEEQGVIEGLPPLLGGVDGDLERLLDLGLADELVQPRRPERGVGEALVGKSVGRGDLGAGAIAHAALFPTGRARHRTGRASASSACRVWHVTHASVARVAPSGTSSRLVEPQLVQIHSAVIAMVIPG